MDSQKRGVMRHEKQRARQRQMFRRCTTRVSLDFARRDKGQKCSKQKHQAHIKPLLRPLVHMLSRPEKSGEERQVGWLAPVVEKHQHMPD